MSISRRGFVGHVALASAWPIVARAQQQNGADRLFRHGVASGDPLADRVMLWTRVTPPPTRNAIGPIEVRWTIARNQALTRIVSNGTALASPARDFTVKVDASGLQPGRTYFYAFDAGGERSPIGRTKTCADDGGRLRLAVVSCSNYPAGYFNVYRRIAERDDLDGVLHLGDYIYEFPNGWYGDGTATGRLPLPPRETVSLDDYRLRFATYRTDADLQAAHARHPFVAVWDDHESANDAWTGGAQNHGPDEGDWPARLQAAYRAYLEWLPVRESEQPGIRLYRRFRFGKLADLVMLDARALRDQQVPVSDVAALADSRRSLLGAAQEAWLFDSLRASAAAGTQWRLVGQQIMFSRVTPPDMSIQNPDVWEGYPAARSRVTDFLARERMSNVAILTGDIHSSWALDVPSNPWAGYDGRSGAGSMAVELVTPAVSSPPLFSDRRFRENIERTLPRLPHLRFIEGERNGYLLIDLTRERLQAEWYMVPDVATRTREEVRAQRLVCEAGSSRLVTG